MRKIVAGLFMTLNGVAESPEKWNFPYFDDEMGAVVSAAMERSDTMLMGRKLYDEWSQFLPAQTDENDPFASHINGVEKIVVSRTLTEPTWSNTTVLAGGLVEGITELKQRDGREIAISGSLTLVRSLLAADLLDELSLLVHPILVGDGKHLFDGDAAQCPLTLVEAKTFKSGVQWLRFVGAPQN